MSNRSLFEVYFSIRHIPDQYKTQSLCDKAVDDYLAALKLVPDWFVTSKMIKELFTALYAEENMLFLMKILVMSCFLVIKWVFLI